MNKPERKRVDMREQIREIITHQPEYADQEKIDQILKLFQELIGEDEKNESVSEYYSGRNQLRAKLRAALKGDI